MQIVEVQDNREKPDSYCPICGIKNIGFSNDSAETKSCDHVIYIGVSEGGAEPELDKENLFERWEDSDDSFVEFYKNKLDNKYTCFVYYQGAPAPLEGYIVYKLDQN